MIDRIWETVRTWPGSIGRWLLGLITGLIKGFIEAPVKKKIQQIIVGFVGTWLLGLVTAPEMTSPINPFDGKSQVLETRADSLNDELRLARTLVLRLQSQMDDTVDAILERSDGLERKLDRVLDSMTSLGRKITAIAEGRGKVEHEGGGKLGQGGYQDPWVIITTRPDESYGSGGIAVYYKFTFEVQNVDVTLKDEQGKQYDVFNVQLRSTTAPDKTMTIGSYKKERQAVHIQEADTRRWRWDPALSFDAVLAREIGIGLTLSGWSFTTGGALENETIARFPDIGLDSDLEHQHHLRVGIRINAAHWLPLLRDFYIAPAYGIGLGGTPSGLTISLGTTL